MKVLLVIRWVEGSFEVYEMRSELDWRLGMLFVGGELDDVEKLLVGVEGGVR
jgi:hypothetical protein